MEPFDACDDSLVDALSAMTEWQDGAETSSESGALFVRGQSRFPTPFSNAVIPPHDTNDGAAILRRAEAFFAGRRYFVWARSVGSDIAERALASGFQVVQELPAMTIESPISSAATSNADVALVADSAAFADFALVSQRAYAEVGLPEGVVGSLLARPEAAMANSTIAVARRDGAAVAAAVSITNAVTGVGGLYWVGTVPEARHRGAADAVTRFVTNAAFAAGACIVTLQASQAGAPLYTKLGYREVGRYLQLLSPKKG